MHLAKTIAELKATRQSWGAQTVALVPTMGALHGGHLSLFEKAKALADKTVVSIYVNPMQFGLGEDFNRYPRQLEQDLHFCQAYGMDLVFLPTTAELYPNSWEDVTQVMPPAVLINQLCGLSRPGHFTGVATVVLKLFNLVQPHFAVFGQKDAQQLAVIQRMVRDLDVPVTIVPAPTVRESDGLAMSSRNQYFRGDSDRQQARLLSRLLITVKALYDQGVVTTVEALAMAKDQVLDETLYPDFELEYLAAVSDTTFLPTEVLDDKTRILVAGKVGNVRLIDNCLLSELLSVLNTTVDATKLGAGILGMAGPGKNIGV